MLRRCLIALLLCPVFVVTARQQPAGLPPPHTFKAGISVVEVDAVVRDSHGASVTTLGKADFELFEDGVQQQVTGVTLVGLPDRSDGKKVGVVTPTPASKSESV